MEAPDWPADDTDSEVTLTVTFTLTLTGGSSSDFLGGAAAEVGLWVATSTFPSSLQIILGTASGELGGGAGVVAFAVVLSVVQVVAGGCPLLAEVEGEWEGESDGEGEGEIEGEGDVCGGSNGMLIQAWLRMSSRWGLLCGRTFKHCLIMSWHSANEQTKKTCN